MAFEAAVGALVAKVRDEGHPGVRSYHFFLTEAAEGRAVVVYDGPEAAWVAHHDIIMGWPEMAALRGASELQEIDLHGPLTGDMRSWIDRMGLSAKVRYRGAAVAGFRRSG